MRLTHHTDYALRVLIYLAVTPQDRVRIRDIADAYDISHHHLTKVVRQLQHAGFVNTVRGKGGGISLARDAADISIGAVVRRLETEDYLVECFSADNACAITGPCTLPRMLREAVQGFLQVLDDYTLDDIVTRRSRALRRALSVDDILATG